MKVWGEPPQTRRESPVRACRSSSPVDSCLAGVRSPIDPEPVEPIRARRRSRRTAIGRPRQTIAVADSSSPGSVETARRPELARVHLTGDPGRDAIALGTAALLDLGEKIGRRELADPIMAAAYRFARSRGERVRASQLLAAYERRESPRPSVPIAACPGPSRKTAGPGSPIYARASGEAVHWRPRDAERARPLIPGAYARWLVEPIAQVQTLELLAELGRDRQPEGRGRGPDPARPAAPGRGRLRACMSPLTTPGATSSRCGS